MRNHIFLLFATVLVLGVPASADESADQIKAFKEEMKTADEAGRVRLIQELAATGNPKAGKEISGYMMKGSTAVRVTAIKAVGQLKVKSSFGKLMGSLKPFEKEPKLLAAALNAIGNYENPSTLKPLTKIAKKWLFKDSEVASAACRSIGRVRTRGAVDTLIDLMDLTFPSQAGSGSSAAAVSTQTRKLLEESRPAILEGLATLTGWDFGHPAAWKKFWEDEGKRWRPSDAQPDFSKIKTWRDPGYGFEVTKPADRWEMSRGKELGKDYEDYRVVVRQLDEGALRAYLYVWAAENEWNYTPRERADHYAEYYRERWEDVKEESWKERDIKVTGESGIEQTFTGMDSTKNVCRIRNRYFVHGEMVVILYGWIRVGTPDDVAAELEKVIESFRFTD